MGQLPKAELLEYTAAGKTGRKLHTHTQAPLFLYPFPKCVHVCGTTTLPISGHYDMAGC